MSMHIRAHETPSLNPTRFHKTYCHIFIFLISKALFKQSNWFFTFQNFLAARVSTHTSQNTKPFIATNYRSGLTWRHYSKRGLLSAHQRPRRIQPARQRTNKMNAIEKRIGFQSELLQRSSVANTCGPHRGAPVQPPNFRAWVRTELDRKSVV